MTRKERESALLVVRQLIEACGPQTMDQILQELLAQAIGCDNIHDAKDFAAYALREFTRFKVLEEEWLEGELYFGFKYSS